MSSVPEGDDEEDDDGDVAAVPRGIPSGRYRGHAMVDDDFGDSDDNEDDDDDPSNSLSEENTGSYMESETADWEEEEDEGEQGERPWSTLDTLAALPAFAHCTEPFLKALADKAPRIEVAVGQGLDLSASTMYVVESGALKVSVIASESGISHEVVIGPGHALGMAAMLGVGVARGALRRNSASGSGLFRRRLLLEPTRNDSLAFDDDHHAAEDSEEAEARRPAEPYEALLPHRPPPLPFLGAHMDDAVSPEQRWQMLRPDALCLYSLCPRACEYMNEDKGHHAPHTAPKPLRVVASPTEGMVAVRKGRFTSKRRATIAINKVTLLAITLSIIEVIGQDFVPQPAASPRTSHSPRRSPVDIFRSNCAELLKRFRWIHRLSASLLPGAPSEVLWCLAEGAHTERLQPGALVAAEGGLGVRADTHEALIIVIAGRAVVEKSKVDGSVVQVAKLGPGALIGELGLLGAKVVHSATVRALTTLEIVVMPVQSIMQTLQNFPGSLTGLEDRLRDIDAFIQEGQPPPARVLSSLPLFAGAGQALIEALAKTSHYDSFRLGQVIKEKGAGDSNLIVLLHGSCVVERQNQQVAELGRGTLFGERGFTGGKPANARVRAATPIVSVFRVSGDEFRDLADSKGWTVKPASPSAASQAKGTSTNFVALARVEAFRMCSPAFKEAILAVADLRSYMPGQLLVEEGGKGQAQTFVLCAGRVAVERANTRVAEMTTGVSFGELLMLSLADGHRVSMRAITFTYTLEITRASFQLVCQKYADEQQSDNSLRRLGEEGKKLDVGPKCQISEGMPPGFAYSLNVSAQRVTHDETCGKITLPQLGAAALTVVTGEATVTENGKKVITLLPGEMFNQEILLGIPNVTNEELLFGPGSEVQILQKTTFDYACGMFDEEHDLARRNALMSLLPRMERRLGFDSTGDTPRLSALFRVASRELAAAARAKMVPVMYEPGEVLLKEGEKADCAIFLLHGSVLIEAHSSLEAEVSSGQEVDAPKVFGEAVLFMTQEFVPATVRASRHCIAGILKRSDFKTILHLHPPNKKLLPGLCREVQTEAMLQNWLAHTRTFSGANKGFLATLCCGAQHIFLAPGETLMGRGDECTLGKSFCYTVLSGQAEVEGEVGIFVDTLQCGHVFGEAGALGLAPQRTKTIRAKVGGEEGLLQCAGLCGPSFEAACHRHPKERERFAELFRKREIENQRGLERRRVWIQENVLPLLKKTSIFSRCPADFQNVVVDRVRIRNYLADAMIFEIGQQADSLFLLVDGTAELQAKRGDAVGTFGTGASFGEAAVLGLLDVRTASLKARTACCVAELQQEVLDASLVLPEFAKVKQFFELLCRDRREQVRLGLPMCALPLHISPDDTCMRAVALQAARLVLPPGGVWEPTPDSSPDGPHFGVLVSGRVVLEIAQGGRWVARLKAGSFVPEGLIANYGAHIRAEVASEAYRVRQLDFLVAAGTTLEPRHWSGSQPPMQDWYGRCRLLEREACTQLAHRFEVARGADEASVPVSMEASMVLGSSPRSSARTHPMASSRSARGAVVPAGARQWRSTGDLDRSQPRPDATLKPGDRDEAGKGQPRVPATQEWRQRLRAPLAASTSSAGEGLSPKATTLPPAVGSPKRAAGTGCMSRTATQANWGSRSLSHLPLLAGGRPGTSSHRTKAFRDERGCCPGDLLMWTLPQAHLVK